MGKASIEKVAVHDLRYVLSQYVKIYAKIAHTYPMNAMEKSPSTPSYPRRRRGLPGVHVPGHIQLIIWLCLLLLGSILLFSRSTAAPTIHLDSFFTLSPESVNRMLVFSPHPDDEILGAGGLIQGVLAQGADVRVVLATNGDGQAWSPVLLDRRPYYPSSQHYVKLGQRRQEESLAALRAIGLPESHIYFLGYADGSLYPMWVKDWSKDTSPVSARYTRALKSPYELTYNAQAFYWGEDVLKDLLAILAEFQPDWVVLPHPSDTHPDHRALSNYVRMAVSMFSADREQDPPRLLAYVVHYGTYPQPRGLNMAKPLLPPSSLVNNDTVWTNYNLSVPQMENKLAAISAYLTQEQVNGSYLRSFARPNELFLEIPVLDLPLIAYEGGETLENGAQASISLKEPFECKHAAEASRGC
jgi:LmbE family N-acetylglucosaminyl deacetylase